MNVSTTPQKKCGSYEKLIVEHFTQALGTLLSVVKSLKENGPGLHEVLSNFLSKALEETRAASTEMSSLEKSYDLQMANLMSNMGRLLLEKETLEEDLVDLQMLSKHALENRDHAKKHLEMQMSHLVEVENHLRQKHLMVEQIEDKMNKLLPLAFGGGLVLLIQKHLDDARKAAVDLQDAVTLTKEAVGQADRIWDDCSRKVATVEAEVSSVVKRMSKAEEEVAQMKAQEKELSEKSQQLKKGDQFLRALHGKVEAARVVAHITGPSKHLRNVFREISKLIQRMGEEGEDVPCLFTAAVRELAAKLPAAVKLLAEQAH